MLVERRSLLAAGCAAAALAAAPFLTLTRRASAESAGFLEHYANMALATYEDALAGARKLEAAIEALLAKPSKDGLNAARRSWLEARVPYLQSEAFRFTNPIVDEWEGKVNSWPLDEGLIDYVAGADRDSDNPLFTANVIANKVLEIGGKTVDASVITPELLRDFLHEAGGLRANVATGWHAIEFLLWGQDLNGTGPGAGDRPFTDYDTAACTNGNCDRRAQYLRVVARLLVEDLAWMVAQWAPGGEARKRIVSMPQPDALVAIFSGVASLSYGELAGERMKLALLLHDPEEEHDCFSDNSHNSHYWDAVGIRNVYLGQYRRPDGTEIKGASVSDVVRAKAPSADADVRKALDHTVARMKVIVDMAERGTAFDQLIAEGNQQGNRIVQDAIDALLAQTNAFRGAVLALDLAGLKVVDSDSLRNPGGVKKR
jgi:putative iron-regulated protein